MTLVDDLQALDLGAVVDARATIEATAEAPDLRAVLEGDVGVIALGDVGEALASVRTLAEHPDQLFDEVLEALPALSAFNGLDELDIGGWADAVQEGAEHVAALMAVLGGDVSRIGELITGAGGDLLHDARMTVDDYSRVGVGELARMRRLVDTVGRGVPTEPQAFARLALDVLLPAGGAELMHIRAGVTGVLEGARAVGLPAGRVAGLLEAHAAVTVAAESGDTAAIQAALAALERTRDATIASLVGDLRFAVEQLNGLRAPQAVEAIAAASEALATARMGTLEFLERLRVELAAAREGIESLDFTEAGQAIVAFVDEAEQRATEILIIPVEEQVAAVEAWVRGLLAHLPLRALRAELSALVEQAVAAIDEADLDAPVEALRTRLDDLETEVSELDLEQVVGDALEAVEGLISEALDAIVGALEAIGTAVDAVADDAAELVTRAVDLLRELAGAIEEARLAIEGLPIEEAQREVIEAIRELRAKAEELFAEVTLPEGLRPIVEQLVEELRTVDFEGALLGPVDEALSQFHVLEDLGITEALRDIQQTLSNLVPTQLASEIEAQLGAVLEGIRAFRPDGIRALVEGFFDDIADAIDDIDLDPVRGLVHEPFGALLHAFDQLKPSVVLGPVLRTYDDLVGAATLPDPVQTTESLMTIAADAAAGLAPKQTAMAERLAPGQTDRVAPVLPPEAGAPPRPGDVVRLFGWLPAKLREALEPLGPEARQAAIAEIGTLVGGLAADMRRMQTEVRAAGERLAVDVETLLAPLATAQMRAQLALSARLSAQAGGSGVTVEAGLDLDASLDLVASAGPGDLRGSLGNALALVTTTADRVATPISVGGSAIDQAAAALERSPLVRLVDDVDAFLEALDPEPLAAELDALLDAALQRMPELFAELGDQLEGVVRRAQRLLLDHNPAALLQRFLKVLDTVREELEILNPHVLARELDAIHDAARATLESYDPAVLVDEAEDLLGALKTAIRNVDLDAIPGEAELAELGLAVQRVEDAVPADALAEAGAALADAGEALQEIDLLALVDEVERLPQRVQDAMHAAVAAVKDELIALLGALRYSQAEASASLSVSESGSSG